MKKSILIAVLVSSLSLIIGQTPAGEKGVYNVGVEVFENYTSLSKVHLLDVRTPKEFEEGHIEGAKNIDYFNKGFKVELDKLDKTLPVYVYCRSGGRSAKSMQIMQELGFESIYNLKGGFLAWSQK